MIAVIERQHKAVWGFGHTAEEAMAHAMKSISEKPWFTVNGLEYAHLAPEAELDCDGEVLWQWVIFDGHEPSRSNDSSQQMGLF